METTKGSIGVVLGLYRDNQKENGNYYMGVWLGFMVRVKGPKGI